MCTCLTLLLAGGALHVFSFQMVPSISCFCYTIDHPFSDFFFFFKSLVYLLLTLGLHALYIEARTERVQLLL